MEPFQMRRKLALTLLLSMLPLPATAEVPDPIAVRGEVLITILHAQGAQVYECRADASRKLVWQFREPIATLLLEGKTVGRHYAGPHWEIADGSAVSAKVSGVSPGPSARDIPLLKLEIATRRGEGQLAGATTIQRINTRGGVADGVCDSAGAFLSVPYTADYAFYRRRD
jgi:hypothetical protein